MLKTRDGKRQIGMASVELMLVVPFLLLFMIIMVNSAKTMLLYEKRVIESRNAAYLVELYEGGEPKGLDNRRESADEKIQALEKIAVDLFDRTAAVRSALEFEITQGDVITLPLGASVMRYATTSENRHDFYENMVQTTRDEMDEFSDEDDPNIMTDKIRKLSKVLTNDYSRSGATTGVSVSAFQGPLGKFQPTGGYLAMRDYHTADFSNKLDLFERHINSDHAISEGYNLKAGYSKEMETMLGPDELFLDVFADTSIEAIAELGAIGLVIPVGEVDTEIGIIPGGSDACSFAGNTLVKTENGYQEIQYISAGSDRVWARDELTGRMGWRDVLAQYSNRYEETVHVTASDSSGNRQTITSNRIHPYFARIAAGALNATSSVAFNPVMESEGYVYVGDIADGAWIDAQYLKPGDELLSANNEWQSVKSVVVEKQPLEAYNLSVDEYSSYFVTDGGDVDAVWVHNDCYNGRPTGFTDTGRVTNFGQKIIEKDGREVYQGHPPNDNKWYDIDSPPPTESILVLQQRQTNGSQRERLDSALGGFVGDEKDAHHLIPLSMLSKYPELLKLAARGGFDINGAEAGMLLGKDKHVGGHPDYNSAVENEVADIDVTQPPKIIAAHVQDIADRLERSIRAGTFGPWR